MEITAYLTKLLQGAVGNLAAYLAAHVLLCLVPAFFIAGGMVALIPREIVSRFLGRNTPKYLSYPAAALAGSVLSVCSCTIVPIFAGIYKKGAGMGPAITFLFFAPAANILALVYTGGLLGADLALARLLLSLAFGIGIGMIMAMIFSREDTARDQGADTMFAGQNYLQRAGLVFLVVMVALLISGTLKVSLLTNSYGQLTLPIGGMDRFQAFLDYLVPFDPSKGEEGVSVQGVILIGLLILIGITAWLGLENILEGFNRWTWTSLAMVVLTLLAAAVRMIPKAEGLLIEFPGKVIGEALTILILCYIARYKLKTDDMQNWLNETWFFVKKIFPLLVAGVFCVGIIRQLIRPEWIEALAGSNSITGNLAGVIFGVFMYFPTLVEVPIAKMFLSLGMHRGPLLAYLMADPELSLQSILITASIIGKLRAWVYVCWVALFSALAGMICGSWIDGAGIGLITLYVAVFLGLLAVSLFLINRRNLKKSGAEAAETHSV